MNTPDVSDKAGSGFSAAWPFGLFVGLWTGGLGLILGWGEFFLTGTGFWQITLIMAGCAFVAGTLAHMALGGDRSLIRASLAGALTPFIAVVLGSGVIALGALPYMALTGLAVVALPLCLPCALLALVYEAVRIRLLSRRRQRDNG
mgnify:CR=1 FL=1